MLSALHRSVLIGLWPGRPGTPSTTATSSSTTRTTSWATGGKGKMAAKARARVTRYRPVTLGRPFPVA